MMSDGIAFAYRAGGGFPPVDLDLRIDGNGQGKLYLGTFASLPNHELHQIGEFAGPVGEGALAPLRALVQAQLLDRAGALGQAEPHAPARYLEITRDGRQAAFRLHGMMADPELDAVERALQGAAYALTERPLAAIEGTLEADDVEGGTRFTICLRGLGSEPLMVILIEPSAAVPRLNARVDLQTRMPLPSGAFLPMAFMTRDLPQEEAARLVETGALKAGELAIAPDETVRIPLPPVDLTASPRPLFATGTVSLLKPEGAARRGMVVITPTLELS